LALHELSTNAAKYGALSTPSGRIEVGWRVVRESAQPPMLRLEWREQGGPAVVAPSRRGFGTRFIEGSVATELQGTATLAFDAAGLRCILQVPVDEPTPAD
jgi:two-component sensor histidine kinase